MQTSIFGFFLLSSGKDIQIVQIKSLMLYIKEARIKTCLVTDHRAQNQSKNLRLLTHQYMLRHS